LFDDESFSYETLRAAGFANYGGADLGEVIVTARAIPEGDEVAWHREWKATAQRVESIAHHSLAAGHGVSAREAFLRASNYYRTAEFYRRVDPFDDPEVHELSHRSRDTFLGAMAQFDFAFAALARGCNVLAFDGPGQGAALREQHLVFRPDWEAVITPVVDFALTRSDVDPSRISLFGYSMGGYLVARAAAFDTAIAALILDDGIYDFHAAMAHALPPFVSGWIDDGNDASAIPVLKMLMARDTQVRWALRNGLWVMGLDSLADIPRVFRQYTLAGVADRITAAVLVLDADNDQFLSGQPKQAAEAMVNADVTLVTLPESEGVGEHCHMGAMARAHQTIFDWLDTPVPQSN
jgi:alpha-beta hydrolase superfamily lysophospholipase